jgi:hypothetical protein
MSFLQETNWSRDRFPLPTVTIFWGGAPAAGRLLACLLLAAAVVVLVVVVVSFV